MERSDPPQPAAAHRASGAPERGAEKNRRSPGEPGRTHWERAERKTPPHIVARGGTFFLKSGLSEPEARTVRRQEQGRGQSGAQRSG